MSNANKLQFDFIWEIKKVKLKSLANFDNMQ